MAFQEERNFILTINKKIIQASYTVRKVATSSAYRVFNILGEVGAELKMLILGFPIVGGNMRVEIRCY